MKNTFQKEFKFIDLLLPDSNIIRSAISKIISAFEDVVQMELLKVRWEEIKKLDFSLSLAPS